MTNNYLKLFANCILVNGCRRSAICDLQRGGIYFIPYALSDLLDNENNSFDVELVKLNIEPEERIILDEYTDFLLEKELAFWCSYEELKHFPKLSQEYLFPAHISNIILDIEKESTYFNSEFLKQLEELCCNHMQIRFYEQINLGEILEIIQFLHPTQMKTIELVIHYFDNANFEKKIRNFMNEYRKVKNIVFYAAPENRVLIADNSFTGSVYLSTQPMMSQLHCGVVQLEQFAINIPHYTESLHHNTCLNRKISIDVDGNIKNCPSMKESYGNIRDTTLKEAIEKPGFKKYWNITKDQIAVCKDCEFRHVCTDCRAYLEDPEDVYSKPLKCGYNPYTCEWEEWSTNPLKQKAIDYYGMRDITKRRP